MTGRSYLKNGTSGSCGSFNKQHVYSFLHNVCLTTLHVFVSWFVHRMLTVYVNNSRLNATPRGEHCSYLCVLPDGAAEKLHVSPRMIHLTLRHGVVIVLETAGSITRRAAGCHGAHRTAS